MTKRFKRILENSQLAVSVAAYLKRRDKITRTEWVSKIKPALKEAENNILQQLRSMELTDWQVYNLKRTLSSFKPIYDRFGEQFSTKLVTSQGTLMDFAVDNTDKQALLAGLKPVSTMWQNEELLGSITTVTNGFTEFFSADMAKIVNSNITLGIINHESPLKVARTLRDAFQSSMMSYARAERIARTEMLRASALAQQKRSEEMTALNPGMRKIWLNSHKPNFRPTHMDAERRYKAEPIKIDEDFYVGGEYGLYPRAYTFSAKNTVNCGCTVVNLPQDFKKEITIK